jgi:DNA invertase Pin-like site-specific DNA recombinase
MSSTGDKRLRAAGYSRTSGEGQRDNTSIPRQREAIDATCQRNGWRLVRHYVDECKSGAKTEGRDDFKRMLQDAAKGEFDVVVPFDATRLARDGVDIVSTAKVLKATFGVFVVDSKGQFDNRDHRNALRNFVQAGVSEHERLTIMERMLGGRIKNAQDGIPWCKNLPVGRDFHVTGKRTGQWGISETGRKLAALLARYAAGEPMTALVREYGFHDSAHVLRHVRDGQLAARPYVVTFHTPDIGIVNLQVPVPAVPPVITPELEQRVRDRLEHNRTWNKQCLRKYLLSGFIRCSHCGAALTCQTTDGVSYYAHHRSSVAARRGDYRDCPFRSIRGDAVEGPVLDYLYRWFVDQPAFDLAVKLALPSEDSRKEREEEARRVERDLAKAEKEITNLVNAVAAGVDPGLLLGKQQGLKSERDALRSRLAELRRELASLPDPVVIREEAEIMRAAMAKEYMLKDWRKESFDDVRRFLHFMFGDSPKREGLGVYVRSEGRGQRAVELRARLRMRSPALVVGDDDFARLVDMSHEGEVQEGEPFSHLVNLLGPTR